MKYKGIVFDFNGVLWFDREIQRQTWQTLSCELRGRLLSSEELEKFVHGRYTEDTLKYLTNYEINDSKLEILSRKKEAIYRKLCLEQDKNFRLSPGSIRLLNFLVKNNITRTIATATGKTNLNFFINHLHLEKWFDTNKIVYNDGTFPGKPEPDIYLKAAKKVGLLPNECVVIEDAKSGIQAAVRARIGKIIALCPKDRHHQFLKFKRVNFIIKNLGEINTEKLFL